MADLKVMAFDPGERVGWARATVREDGSWDDLRHGIASLRDMAVAWDAKAHEYDVVVIETWRLRADMARQFSGSQFLPVQFIGAAKLPAWREGLRIVTQAPAIKKLALKSAPQWLAEKLATFPKTHDDAHDYDALLHLWQFTFKEVI